LFIYNSQPSHSTTVTQFHTTRCPHSLPRVDPREFGAGKSGSISTYEREKSAKSKLRCTVVPISLARQRVTQHCRVQWSTGSKGGKEGRLQGSTQGGGLEISFTFELIFLSIVFEYEDDLWLGCVWVDCLVCGVSQVYCIR